MATDPALGGLDERGGGVFVGLGGAEGLEEVAWLCGDVADDILGPLEAEAEDFAEELAAMCRYTRRTGGRIDRRLRVGIGLGLGGVGHVLGLRIDAGYPIGLMDFTKRGFSMMRHALFMLLAVVLLTGGCARSYSAKFPYGRSIDRHNFVSTPDLPLTVTLKDTITGEELLRVDVPVYKQLIIDLEHKKDWNATLTPALPAETCTWDVVDAGRNIAAQWDGKLKNRMNLPGNPVILKVDIRETESATQIASNQYKPVAPTDSGQPQYQPVGPATPAPTPPAPPAPAPAQPTQPDATSSGPAVGSQPAVTSGQPTYTPPPVKVSETIAVTRQPALDRHEWVSTKARPLTVSIVNTTSDANELSLDVPPGKKLVIDLYGEAKTTRATGADWQIIDAEATAPQKLENTQALSGQPIIFRVAQRPSMEDDASSSAPAPKYTPVESPATPAPAPGGDLEDALE